MFVAKNVGAAWSSIIHIEQPKAPGPSSRSTLGAVVVLGGIFTAIAAMACFGFERAKTQPAEEYGCRNSSA